MKRCKVELEQVDENLHIKLVACCHLICFSYLGMVSSSVMLLLLPAAYLGCTWLCFLVSQQAGEDDMFIPKQEGMWKRTLKRPARQNDMAK
jgi:hypothetical protein